MLTSSSFGDDITYSFSDNLFDKFLNDNHKLLKKPFEVAMKYGFRGYSSGGKNGIFLMRKGDERLISSLDNLVEDNRDYILKDLEVDKIENLKKVKIVWHNNTGERILGVYNPPNRRMLFLDTGSY